MVCNPQTHASKPNSFFSISASLKDLLYSILSFIIARSILYQVDRDHAADRKSVHTHVATTATLNPNRSNFTTGRLYLWIQIGLISSPLCFTWTPPPSHTPFPARNGNKSSTSFKPGLNINNGITWCDILIFVPTTQCNGSATGTDPCVATGKRFRGDTIPREIKLKWIWIFRLCLLVKTFWLQF